MSLTAQLATLLGVFALAFVVRLLVSGVTDVSYSVLLVLVGFGVSLAGVQPALVLSHDVIVAVLLPTLLFRGAVELDHQQLRQNLVVPVALVVLGVPLAVGLLGAAGIPAFGFPPVVAFLFAVMVVPTDPAAVVSLFEELGAPDRLSVIVDSESLLNDGVAVVVFGVLFELLRAAPKPDDRAAQLLSPGTLVELGADFVVIGIGGLAVGVVAGYLGHRATEYVHDEMATVLLTVILAYGSFLLADHVLGVSGILATVGTGLSMGMAGEAFTAQSEHAEFVRSVWDATGFLVSTLVYVLVGAQVRPDALVGSLDIVVLAAVLVVLVRGVVVYGVVGALNATVSEGVPTSYQHVMVWGGLHTVVPVALVLSLPADVPFRSDLRVMVFGIAVLGTVVQGLLMPFVLERTGVT
ncbi:cation:proton antiporter [Halorussus ruber]|uniref:cation:proton antiporter n=1 Tax=Halorussus ruber TaxID=1126238 RepID=UPI0010919D57|nr:cation:proton antiporter [Halorussus ruber]